MAQSWEASLGSAIRDLEAEERRLEQDLERVRAALRALGAAAARGGGGAGARRLSPEGREAIARAARKRWAEYRRQRNPGASPASPA
jgi:hypothetical protein